MACVLHSQKNNHAATWKLYKINIQNRTWKEHHHNKEKLYISHRTAYQCKGSVKAGLTQSLPCANGFDRSNSDTPTRQRLPRLLHWLTAVSFGPSRRPVPNVAI